MIARPLEYFEPHFLDEALVVLDRFDGAARALAGGTRLVPELRRRARTIAALVNLKRIASLHEVSLARGALSLGALVTAKRLSSDATVREAAPLLALAASTMGSPQIRMLATIGGNICCGDPASDLVTALLALDAECRISSHATGERSIPLAQLLIAGPALRADEVLTSVVVAAESSSFAYVKMHTRRGFEMALVGAAVSMRHARDRVERVRIALAGAAPTCVRAPHAERGAIESPDRASAIHRASTAAAELDAAPISDLRASAEYRKQLVRVLTKRALAHAWLV